MKSIVLEIDYTLVDGAGLLFEATKRHLGKIDAIAFDASIEARYMVGRSLQDGLAVYFAAVKTKKTAVKAAREINALFVDALNAAFVAPLTQGVRNFLKTLADREVKVFAVTRANAEVVRGALGPFLGDGLALIADESTLYGTVGRDPLRQACLRYRLRRGNFVAVTSSGIGVKTALLAGLNTFAITNARTIYQDFTGACDVVGEVSTGAARRLLAVLER